MHRKKLSDLSYLIVDGIIAQVLGYNLDKMGIIYGKD